MSRLALLATATAALVAAATGTPTNATAFLDGVPSDPAALALLHEAGTELARLALALGQRLGPLPVALAGRVFALHSGIEAALRGALPGVDIHTTGGEPLEGSAHDAAARLAATTSRKEIA